MGIREFPASAGLSRRVYETPLDLPIFSMVHSDIRHNEYNLRDDTSKLSTAISNFGASVQSSTNSSYIQIANVTGQGIFFGAIGPNPGGSAVDCRVRVTIDGTAYEVTDTLDSERIMWGHLIEPMVTNSHIFSGSTRISMQAVNSSGSLPKIQDDGPLVLPPNPSAGIVFEKSLIVEDYANDRSSGVSGAIYRVR